MKLLIIKTGVFSVTNRPAEPNVRFVEGTEVDIANDFAATLLNAGYASKIAPHVVKPVAKVESTKKTKTVIPKKKAGRRLARD